MPVPMLLHEAVDARTFPRLEASLQAYEGSTIKAEVIYSQSINRMQTLGLLNESDRWAEASEMLYSLILKALIENYRFDPAISGYEVRFHACMLYLE